MRLLVLTCAFLVSATVCVVSAYDHRWISNISIKAHDNITLFGNAYVPISETAGEEFPVLIFPNSWGFTNKEYLFDTYKFSKRGYICFEYTTRGWYTSGGSIDVAGPLDRADGSTVIDYVLGQTEWRANKSSIAFVGISYGGGISLLMAGHDARVTTVVGMSGWGSLIDSFMHSNSPNVFVLRKLLSESQSHGHMPADTMTMLSNLMTFKDLPHMRDFASFRSPSKFLPRINSRKVPLFLSTNMNDRFFSTEDVMGFWMQVEGQKFMLINQGAHAEPEYLAAYLLPNNYIWQKAGMWLDQILKGVETGILSEPNMQFEYGKTIFSSTYVKFDNWPRDEVSRMQRFQLGYRGDHFWDRFGSLTPVASEGGERTRVSTGESDTITYSTKTGLTIGAFGTIDILSSFGVEIPAKLALVEKDYAIVFETRGLTSSSICGIPTVTVSFTPRDVSTGTASTESWQIYAFLYDVDALQLGRLISDGAVAYSTIVGNSTTDSITINGDVVTVSEWKLRPVCTSIASGHRIALGFTLYNEYFTPVTSLDGRVISATFDYANAWVDLPLFDPADIARRSTR